MHQNQTFLQKVGGVLNASSTTFMLIALVSLFVIPVVIAQNLEPVVDSSSSQPTAIRMYDPTSNATEVPANTTTTNTTEQHGNFKVNVLGTTDSRDMKLYVTEDVKGLAAITGVTNYVAGEVDTTIKATTKFNKTAIYKIRNISDANKAFALNVINKGDVKSKASTGKILYVDNTAYEVGSNKVPTILTLTPSQEVTVYVASAKTNPTDLLVTLILQD